jgi:GrpB-like predicted nucleotidyltransferase (UPF0157 family)
LRRNIHKGAGPFIYKDYVIDHPQVAREYAMLKKRLSGTFKANRVEYTKANTDFIERITKIAIECYGKAQQQL